MSQRIAQEYCCDFQASGILSPSRLNTILRTNIYKEPVEKRWIETISDLGVPRLHKQYIVSADVARGDGTDFSTFHVICVETCTQVAEFRSRISTRDLGIV